MLKSSLPKHLWEFLLNLRQEEKYQLVLKALPAPKLPRWRKDRSETEWAYASGKQDGAVAILKELGYKVDIPEEKD